MVVYEKSNMSSRQLGYLKEGEIYPRNGDLGEWHKIKFGNGDSYVRKQGAIPVNGDTIPNINPGLQNTNRVLTAMENLTVYANSTGSLVPFATLTKDVDYPILGELGADWYQIDLAGRIGYVYKPATTRPFDTWDRYFKAL